MHDPKEKMKKDGMAGGLTGGKYDRKGAKHKVLSEIMDYASGGMAKQLREKHHPRPMPVVEPETHLDSEQEGNVDLSALDDATIKKMLGG